MKTGISRKTWGELSRSQRKLAVIRHKAQILREADFFGGLFVSDTGTENSSFNDIVFLSGIDPLRFYNGSIFSGPTAYFEHCDILAAKAADRALPKEASVHPDPIERLRLRRLRSERELVVFGGISRHEWIQAESCRLADSGDVFIHPSTTLDFNFYCGVGFEAVLPDQLLSAEAIEALILRFRSGGELALKDRSVIIQYPNSERHLTCSACSLINPGEPSFISARKERAAIELSVASDDQGPKSRRAL